MSCGQWPKDKTQKEVGAYQLQNMLDETTSYGMAHFTRVLGWSVEEYQVLVAGVRNQLRNNKLRLYAKFLLRVWTEAMRVVCK